MNLQIKCSWEDPVKFNRPLGMFAHIFFCQDNHNLQSKSKEAMREEPWDWKMFGRSIVSIKVFWIFMFHKLSSLVQHTIHLTNIYYVPVISPGPGDTAVDKIILSKVII